VICQDDVPSTICRVDSREDCDFSAGTTLRFGGGLEVVGSEFELHGTNRTVEEKCVVKVFGPGMKDATVRNVAKLKKSQTRVTEVAPRSALIALPSSTPDLREKESLSCSRAVRPTR
jgi:hypothetical protein